MHQLACILLDMEGPDGTLYILPPPMAGFFEFSMMRVRDDIDQQLLSEQGEIHNPEHAHLKDVDAALAARVQAGELTYTEAVRLATEQSKE